MDITMPEMLAALSAHGSDGSSGSHIDLDAATRERLRALGVSFHASAPGLAGGAGLLAGAMIHGSVVVRNPL